MEKDLGDLNEPALGFLPSCWACALSLGDGNDGGRRASLPHSSSSAPSSSSSSSTAWSGARSGGRYVAASALQEARRRDHAASTRRRLLKGFSGLAISLAAAFAAASARLVNDLDLPA
jgi:hypothetical protein